MSDAPASSTAVLSTSPAAGPTTSAARPRRRRISGWMPLLLVLAGVAVLLYPVLATQFNNFKQHQFSENYNSDVEHADTSVLEEGLARAREYNASLPGVPILDPYLEEVQDPDSEAFDNYLSQLNDFDGVMARVRVPAVDIDLPVRHGTEESSIHEGAGHLYGTALPVGGESTHAVVTSHTGMADATLFDHLIDVKKGDLMFIDVYGETLAYEVDQIKVVTPDEISDLETVEGKDYLTLFTCTPYAVNSHRLLVRGHRVDYTPELEAQAEKDAGWGIHLESWMWWLLAAAAVGATSVGTISVRERRIRERAAVPETGERTALAERAAAPETGEGADPAENPRVGGDAPD